MPIPGRAVIGLSTQNGVINRSVYCFRFGLTRMKLGKGTANWTPDKKISWGASLLVVVLTNFFLIFLQSIGSVDFGRGSWWIGLAVGGILATALNWLRPPYDRAGRFWKPIYRFLLEQMPPPD